MNSLVTTIKSVSPIKSVTLPSVAPSAGQKKLSLYIAGAVFGYVASVHTPPGSAWGWALFLCGLGSVVVVTIRAFMDQTLSRQSPPPDTPGPNINGPNINGPNTTLNGP